ncbi:J domain-containing protein [Actinomadura sp. 1N219]|uniref:J domain-containing protein n=1 Tax=Actinomadura sp. 1N219 TaxID=3375152 RepID=UPI0037931874
MPRKFAELDGHDAYDLLGVGLDATPEEIRRAHITLVRMNHPDRFQEARTKAEGADLTRLLNAARDVLLKERASYDAYRAPAGDALEEDPGLVDDPWESASEGRPRAPSTPSAPPPPRQDVPYRRMPPPPRYGMSPTWPPPPAPFRPAPRVRVLPKVGIAVGIVLAVYTMLFVASAVVSELRPDASEPRAEVPRELAGTWHGTIKDRPVEKGDKGWRAGLTLRAGKRNGDVRYLDGQCSGTAVPIALNGWTLTIDTRFPETDAGCDVGDISLTPEGRGKVELTVYSPSGEKSAAGTLTRD